MRERIEQFSRIEGEQGDALTAQGRAFEELRDRITSVRAEIATYEEALGRINVAQQRRGFGPGQELRAAEDVLSRLLAIADEFGIGLAETAEEAEEHSRRIARSFTPINTTLLQAVQQVHAFEERLEDATEAARRASLREYNISIGEQAPQERTFQALASQRQEAIDNELRRRERALRDAVAEEAQTRRDLALSRTAVERQGLAIGTDAYKQAQQQTATLERNLVRVQRRVEAEREALRVAEETLQVNYDALRAQAAAQRQAEVAGRLADRPEAGVPDTSGQRRRAEETLQALRNRVADAQRSALQQALIDAADAVTAAGLRARFEAENQFADQAREATQRLTAAKEELAVATQRERFLVTAVRVANDQNKDALISKVDATRQHSRALAEEIVNIEALIEALDHVSGGYRETTEQLENVARATASSPLRDLAAQAGNLGDTLEEVTTGGLMNLEEGLVGLFTGTKQSLGDLVDALLTDLIQALIRVTITANLAQAALNFSGGGGGIFGGILSFLGFHEGGVVGRDGQTLRRSPSRVLRPRERFAILEEEEEVLKRRDPRHRWNIQGQSWNSIQNWVSRLPRYHEGGVVGRRGGPGGGNSEGSARVDVRLINQSSTPLQASDVDVRFDGQSFFISALIQDVSRRGPGFRALAQALRTTR